MPKLSDYFTIQATGSWNSGISTGDPDSSGGVYYMASAGATLTLTTLENMLALLEYRLRYRISPGGSLSVTIQDDMGNAYSDVDLTADQETGTLIRDNSTYPPYDASMVDISLDPGSFNTVITLTFTPGSGADYVKLSEILCDSTLLTEADALGGGGALGKIRVSGENRKILRGFLRVNGVNRKIKAAYIGAGGAARKIVG